MSPSIRLTVCASVLSRQARLFSSTASCREIRDVASLPERIYPAYKGTKSHDLLALHWPSPPRNILLTMKQTTGEIEASLVEYVKHIYNTYPAIGIILEPQVAEQVHERLPFPVYAMQQASGKMAYADKVDLVSTLGGDGTILHAVALFNTCINVPPVLSFSMGSLGFLGEWPFFEFKRAFREVYMSGATAGYGNYAFHDSSSSPRHASVSAGTPVGWALMRGKTMGSARSARVLIRNRLRFQVTTDDEDGAGMEDVQYAMNEVTIHRGGSPHLAVIDVFIGGKFLTSGVADGMIVSTPTGSTAYSLSAGGSIVHPLVPSVLLTPICPRSLSFRPLVLPANVPISMRLNCSTRAERMDVSIDGVRQPSGLSRGMQILVTGQAGQTAQDAQDPAPPCLAGVPSVVRSLGDDTQDHWITGLNGLLKFNNPFGDGGSNS